MSDNGDGSVLELSSGELEGENSGSSKFKCNLSADNIPLSMGLNSEYCNNGGTSGGHLGLNLLQNFDESNLFHCDISGVFEWIRQRTDSVSSADLEFMRIDCNEAVVTTSELTSSSEEPVCVGEDLDGTGQLDPTFSASVSNSLSNHSQNDHLNSSLLDELTCLQTDDHMKSGETESLIDDSVYHYSLPQKESGKFDNLSVANSPIEHNGISVSKGTTVNENSISRKTADERKSKLKIFKSTSSLPFIKVPKKCILSGKILKRDAYSLNKSLIPTLTEPLNYDAPLEIQAASINNNIEVVPQCNFTSETVCDNGFENNEEMQLMLTEDRLKSHFPDGSLQTTENDTSISLSTLDSQEKSGAKTVVAISTNKLEDVTEVCIKTEKGEELYKGKASELLKATNSSPNLLLRFDSGKKEKQKLLLQKSGNYFFI